MCNSPDEKNKKTKQNKNKTKPNKQTGRLQLAKGISGAFGTGMFCYLVNNHVCTINRCPSAFCKSLAPMFQLDPLFKRTYLLAIPLKSFDVVVSHKYFNVLEVCTTLTRLVYELRSCQLWKEEVKPTVTQAG